MKNVSKQVVRRLRRKLTKSSRAAKVVPFCEQDPTNDEFTELGQKKPKNRILLITQPKAGTYLVAEIVKVAGFHNTNLHLGAHRLQAYDSSFFRTGLFNPRMFDVSIGIDESRKLIRCGELAVSHLTYSDNLAQKLAKFKIIHVKRELRNAFRSWARMLLHSGRSGQEISQLIGNDGIAGFMNVRGRNGIKQALSINNWSSAENVLSLKMEEVLSDPEGAIREVIEHVESDTTESVSRIWERVRTADTLTKSEKYPDLKWTSIEEEVFREIGGPQANRILGYSEQGVDT